MGASWKYIDKENCIGRKYIDKSIFKYGVHIPVEYRNGFTKNLEAEEIELGKAEKIKLVFDDYIAQVEIRNINSKSRSETIQIRYDSNKEFIGYLKKKFEHTYGLIETKMNDIDTDEYIEFFKGNEKNSFYIKYCTHKSTDALEGISDKFIDAIKTTSMSKSYKIPTLLTFYNSGDMKLKVDYKDIAKMFQNYYSEKHHREDLNNKEEIENWGLNQYLSKAKETGMKYLPQEYFYDDKINKQFCIIESLQKYINNETFINKYKKAIDFLEIKYFKLGSKDQFILWLGKNTKLSKSSIEKYSAAISKISEIYFNDKQYLYSIESIENLNEEIEKLTYSEEFKEKDIKGNRMYSNALKKLSEFRNSNVNIAYNEVNNNVTEIRELDKTDKELLINIQNYIKSQGYNYTYEQISNLYLSLKTKPFVILAGISGTGKSKIVRLLAEALGATTQNKQFNMISVRPDWNDSTELIGYKNLQDKFIEGHLTKIIKQAQQNKNKPYFVCLDEMNLARVEYYLSDYLSIIESRKKIGQEIITDNVIEETENIYLPENLYLIGTVNMDDSTFTFSRKVLDRANTIEFSDVDLENLFMDDVEEVTEVIDIDNNFLKTNYLKTSDIENEYRDYAKEVNTKIIQINEILKKSQKQFAYRVRDEILFYMLENEKADLLDKDLAFDYQIMQKILPAISGSESSVGQVLIDLFNYICEKEVISSIDIEEAEGYISKETIRYKNSAEKILYMLRGYDNDGYVSYWY